MNKSSASNGGICVQLKRIPIKFCFAIFFGLAVFLYLISIAGSTSPLTIKLLPTDSVTVLINTFKRHELMEQSVLYYAKCPLVKQISIVWSEGGEPPEDLAKSFAKSHSPKISFEKHPTGSLNNRFKPLQGPHSDAIFNVDDDMKVPCNELALGYQVWKGSKNSIVGYMPRVHVRGAENQYVYRCWWRVWWMGSYSIILTKAAFLHHDYFNAYTNIMPKSIRDMVDNKRNCEDIAMQFLVSNMTQLPPIYVKGHLEDGGVVGGLSTNSNVIKATHMDHRSQCLNDLVHIYGKNPLVSSNFIVDSASNGWTNEPSTWWEYISSDLWNWF